MTQDCPVHLFDGKYFRFDELLFYFFFQTFRQNRLNAIP